MRAEVNTYRVMPLFVATIRTGDRSLSRAPFRKEKHSMSSIWTSSINNTCRHKRRHRVECECRQTKRKDNTDILSGTYPRNDLCLALLPPLAHFGINLLTHFRLDLSGVSGEQGQEALCAAVDDVDLVEGHRVDHLFPLLQLPLWTLYKLCLQGQDTNIVITKT